MDNCTEKKLKAAMEYKEKRERCRNNDGSPYELSHASIMAFMSGFDAAYGKPIA